MYSAMAPLYEVPLDCQLSYPQIVHPYYYRCDPSLINAPKLQIDLSQPILNRIPDKYTKSKFRISNHMDQSDFHDVIPTS